MTKLPFIALLIGLAGCSRREIRPSLPPNINDGPPDYEDLRVDEVLQVVIPVLKSGATALNLSDQKLDGTTMSLSAADLIGYETIRYAITGKRGDRVQLNFASAQITKNGASSPISEPPLPAFLPRRAEFIRLIYLQRLSEADHNMAIVASKHMDHLNTLTMEIRKNSRACISSQTVSCSWVPAGIAVRPEKTNRK
jgi:hypothetical protein